MSEGPAGEFASHRLRVAGVDVEDLVLRAGPGFSVSGRVSGRGGRVGTDDKKGFTITWNLLQTGCRPQSRPGALMAGPTTGSSFET